MGHMNGGTLVSRIYHYSAKTSYRVPYGLNMTTLEAIHPFNSKAEEDLRNYFRPNVA
jgi:hypothetical protein